MAIPMFEFSHIKNMETPEEVTTWLYRHGHGPGTAEPIVGEWVKFKERERSIEEKTERQLEKYRNLFSSKPGTKFKDT